MTLPKRSAGQMATAPETEPPAPNEMETRIPAQQAGRDQFIDVDLSRTLCPYARTTTAYQLETRDHHMFGTGCRRWACPICGPRKRAGLVRRIVQAAPSKFITLTCRHEGEPNDQMTRLVRGLPRLATELRRDRPEFEYVRMVEQCQDGYPHFHLLARTKFIAQHTLSKIWERLVGAAVVDIRKAHGRSLGYVSKYITKARDSNGVFSRQRISVSKAFWREEQNNESEFLGFSHDRTHPTEHVRKIQDSYTPSYVRYGLYRIDDRMPGDELPEELRPYAPDDPRQQLLLQDKGNNNDQAS